MNDTRKNPPGTSQLTQRFFDFEGVLKVLNRKCRTRQSNNNKRQNYKSEEGRG